jgi:hypothetical protein
MKIFTCIVIFIFIITSCSVDIVESDEKLNEKSDKIIENCDTLHCNECIMCVFVAAVNEEMKQRNNIRAESGRVGKYGYASVSVANDYTLTEALTNADLVADITVIEYLGESNMPYGASKSFFRVQVNELFKGEYTDEFTLMQTGNSEYTIEYFPLLQAGDRMLVFVNKAVDAESPLPGLNYWSDLQNPYWLITEHFSIMDIQTVDNIAYAMDRMGWLTRDISNVKAGWEWVTLLEHDVMEKVRNEMRKHDPILTNYYATLFSPEYNIHKNIFLFDEIRTAIIQ